MNPPPDLPGINPYAAPAEGDEQRQLDEAMAVYDRHPRLARIVDNNFAVYVQLWRLDRVPPGWPRLWHWPAFLFDFHWLLYRRMYLLAVLYIVLGYIGGIVIGLAGVANAAVWWVVLAMKLVLALAANGLYLRRCRAVIARAEALHPGDPPRVDAAIDRRRGVSLYALAIGIGWSVLNELFVRFA
ncbi:DUF2628 domain-containing protein [Stenotrophomonas sp. 24(2023)]|uniref:DUF2628 domain-containing protein n=1 Tax=Stenotrophomonas sp. 24(2023) TaxID=3068324 RepID=UPI0027E07BF5|nr:DUF2628 domain-containing protein [Stenotrophomonas sp. 24(2023)]WMJ71027.1 DUF2628 domain-containing protein [Stenotrophomonas sp. 24(2023)]